MKFAVLSSDPLYKYHEKGEIKTRYWNPEDMFNEVHVFSFCDRDIDADKVQELAGNARLKIIPIGAPSPVGFVSQYRTLTAALREIRPDLMRAHNPWHAGSLGVLAGAAIKCPVVISLHTHYGARRRYERRILLQLLRPFERFSIGRASHVWCVSDYLTDYARSMGARKVSVIYNRVYTDQFEVVERKVNRRPVILSVGRLDPPKDQECIIRSIRDLDVELVLVGDGVNRDRMTALVRELSLADRVRFIGSVPHVDIGQYYAAADLFAIATHYEGFCIPVLEAMAAGLPVVASDTQPLPEILGGAGIVVDHDPDAFHLAISKLIGDAALRREKSDLALARAHALEGAEMERREASLYRQLIEGQVAVSGEGG